MYSTSFLFFFVLNGRDDACVEQSAPIRPVAAVAAVAFTRGIRLPFACPVARLTD